MNLTVKIQWYAYTGNIVVLLKDPRVKRPLKGAQAALAAVPAEEESAAIRWAATNGHTEVVALLLQDPRVDPTAVGNAAIRGAAWYGHTEVVALLLQDPRVDPAAMANAAIGCAAMNDHVEVVALLLQDVRVNPAANENAAIKSAARYGYPDIIALLLRDPRVRAHCPRHPCITQVIQHTLSHRLLIGLYMKQHPHRAEMGLLSWIACYDSLQASRGKN